MLAGCAIVPLAACVDSLMVANCMRGLNYTAPQVQSAFALYTGIASPMTYFPALVCAGLALGLVPRIQGHLARRDFASMRQCGQRAQDDGSAGSACGRRAHCFGGAPDQDGLWLPA